MTPLYAGRKQDAEKALERVRRYRTRHLKGGLCVLCGAKAVTRRHCEYHRERQNTYTRRYRKRQAKP